MRVVAAIVLALSVFGCASQPADKPVGREIDFVATPVKPRTPATPRRWWSLEKERYLTGDHSTIVRIVDFVPWQPARPGVFPVPNSPEYPNSFPYWDGLEPMPFGKSSFGPWDTGWGPEQR